MTINDVGYGLNTATTSGSQVDPVRDIDTVNHTSNGKLTKTY